MIFIRWWHDFYIGNPKEFVNKATEPVSDFYHSLSIWGQQKSIVFLYTTRNEEVDIEIKISMLITIASKPWDT